MPVSEVVHSAQAQPPATGDSGKGVNPSAGPEEPSAAGSLTQVRRLAASWIRFLSQPAGWRIIAYAATAVLGVMACLVLRRLTWSGGPVWHTFEEVVSTALAFFVTTLALVRYSSQKNTTLLFISAGYAGATVLEAFHVVVTSLRLHEHLASPLPNVVPWSWLTSRSLLSLMLFLAYLSLEWQAMTAARPGARKKDREHLVYLAAGLLAASGLVVVALAPLPDVSFPELFFARPLELLPAFLFLYAFVGFLSKGRWREELFEHWLLLSLLTGALTHGLFMAFSLESYDSMFHAAHLFKVLSHGMLLTGLLVSIRELYREVEGSVRATASANELLREQMAERDRMVRELRLEQRRLTTLARLNEMSEAPLTQITDFALEQAVALTRSTIGYLAFLNEDESVLTMHSWSRSAMAECAMRDKPIVYPVATTGLWGEAVRQRKPVVTNDYQTPNPWKKGCPQGHVRVTRHMNVPVFDGNRIVALAGVGNKEEGYDESDILQLKLLMTGMWGLIHRRKVLEELRSLNETLEQRVGERTALAEKRARELERSNAELEQFAYVASHDLQEPLRMVASYTQLLARRYQGKLDADADDFIRFAVDGATRMKTVINDLLAFSRVGRTEKPLVPTDCNTLLRQALEDLEVSIKETGAKVTADPLPSVLGDPVQLERLFQNLLGNAMKFRSDVPPEIHVSVAPEGGDWCFSVRDNGIGIPPECQQRVFQIFQRFHDRTKYPGSGIGLAMCKKIVARHGGRVWMESSPGEGSTFRFTLPIVQEPSHEHSIPRTED